MITNESNPRAVLAELIDIAGNQRKVTYANQTVYEDTVPRAHQLHDSAFMAWLSRSLSVHVFPGRTSSTSSIPPLVTCHDKSLRGTWLS